MIIGTPKFNFLLLIASFIFLIQPSIAQEVVDIQEVTIEFVNGVAIVNGQELPAGQVHQSLDLSQLEGRMQFVGTGQPMLQLHGNYYSVRNDSIVLVRLLNLPALQRGAKRMREQSQAHDQEVHVTVNAEAARRKIRTEANNQIDQLTQVIIDVPQVRNEVYFRGLQSENQEMYERLLNERKIEQEVNQLVFQIRSSQDDDERKILAEQLKQQLVIFFELKQENRRDEIRLLEEKLTALQTRVDEREEQKRAIIERYFQNITGITAPLEWE